jgi:hypothetical protein
MGGYGLANRMLDAYHGSTTWQLIHNTRHQLHQTASKEFATTSSRAATVEDASFLPTTLAPGEALDGSGCRVSAYSGINMQGPHGNHPKDPYFSSPSFA